MLDWVKANGGPLAIVVVGVSIIGFTNYALGMALVGVGLVWFGWTLPAVRRLVPWTLVRKSEKFQLALDAIEDAGAAVTNLIRRRAIKGAEKTGEVVPADDAEWALNRRGDPDFDLRTVRLYYEEGIREQVQDALRTARDLGQSSVEDETAANSVNNLDDLVALRKRIIDVRNGLKSRAGG